MSSPEAPSAKRFQVSLSRDLGLFDVTMIGVGAMIGAGIFGLTGIAAGEAGPVGLLLAFFLNGVVTSLTGLTYAELGSMYPQAGGGYAWVKLGLRRIWGFYAGWISWFSHSVACALYAVLFGTFAAELIELAALSVGIEHVFGDFENLSVKVLAAGVALLFAAINVRGSSETGLVGNVITVFKVVVLGALVVFGVIAMAGMDNWADNFMNDPSPLPEGIGGVILAMGLTFVAFEGYEIIAQSGEEVKAPERNVPRAIFLAIGIVVLIYVAVAFVSVGALVQDEGVPNWQYLGKYGERAMIETARAIMPWGALVMILGGLASTMSALNATIYSSSRVSFAMGRDGDLPSVFGRIHTRNKTPHWAILISAALIMLTAIALPVADVASGASITFLLLFLMVNVALIRLRKTHPDMERPFRVPLVPAIPVLSIGIQLVLAIELFKLSPVAWFFTLAWLAFGLLVYQRYGAAHEARKERDTILLEEAVVTTRGYLVLLPLANEAVANSLARFASLFAQANDGELLALHVVYVPQQIGITDGRQFIQRSRPLLDEAVSVADEFEVPVRTMLRLGRDVRNSIVDTARERRADLIVMGWPGRFSHAHAGFGTIVHLLSSNPPCDMAVVRQRRTTPPKRIVVPMAGGPNSRLALEIAVTQSEALEARNGGPVEVLGVHMVTDAGGPDDATRAADLRRHLDIESWEGELRVVRCNDVVQGVLDLLDEHDSLVVGASEEGLLEQSLFGSIPERLADEAPVNVVMVKQYDVVKFRLRRWLLRRRDA